MLETWVVPNLLCGDLGRSPSLLCGDLILPRSTLGRPGGIPKPHMYRNLDCFKFCDVQRRKLEGKYPQIWSYSWVLHWVLEEVGGGRFRHFTMLLTFRDAVKLKTKKIIYEEGCNGCDSARLATLEKLKELSSRRKAIEESTNKRVDATDSGEMAVGLTSQNQQDLQKLEQYLPFLVYLLSYIKSLPKTPKIHSWVSGLKIQWSSAMTSCYIKIGGPKFFRVDDLRFELGMSLFLYGAILRERAFETFSTGDLVESTTFFRKAAGVYNHLAGKVLPLLKYSLPKGCPVEATSSLSSIMNLMCLADAQAVTVKRAEEKGNSMIVLSKLHYGITQMLDEATSILTARPRELNDLSPMVKELVSTCKVLHELRSQRCLAEDFRSKEQIGTAIAVLRQAMCTAKKAQKPKNESYALVFNKELDDAADMVRKFEHENDFVWHDKIPSVNKLLALQGTSIVKAIPYEVQKWEGEEMSFII